MNTYFLEGLAPLVFRSGKPFGSNGADGNNFPLPSSAAGLVRTLWADQQGLNFGDPGVPEQLRELSSAGPLLARRSLDGKQTTLLVPRPADAVCMDTDTGKRVLRLAPASLPEHSGCDLPDKLQPVCMLEAVDGKPDDESPQFWPLATLLAWCAGEEPAFDALKRSGLAKLPSETRTHVALDDHTLAADSGRLFQTIGLDLGPQRKCDPDDEKPLNEGWGNDELGFVIRTGQSLDPTLATFGGERRLSRLHPINALWPSPPVSLANDVQKAGGLRITLLTPAIFSGGYLPGWLDADTLTGTPPGCEGLHLTLRAAAIERWVPVSGWDLQQHKPKATRKAVAAGATYWFDIRGDVPTEALSALWLSPISDADSERRDGFGLALPAAWHQF